MKLMKQGVDMLPKDLRKEALQKRKEEKEAEQMEKVWFTRIIFPSYNCSIYCKTIEYGMLNFTNVWILIASICYYN